MLLDKIKADALDARKTGKKVRATILTTLIGECERLDKNASDEVTDTVGRKMIKNANIALDISYNIYIEAERNILREYFPDRESAPFKEIVHRLIGDNPDKEINDKTVGWFVGQVMKETKGGCNPADVRDYILSL